MKQNILNKLVRALISGRYKKTTGQLRDSETGAHCVLGVLCDLHSKETGTKGWSGSKYLGNSMDLPEKVIDWAGLNGCDPRLTEDESATELNDGVGGKKVSFKQLAKLWVKAQKAGLLGKIIKERKRKAKKPEPTTIRTISGTGISGELDVEQPEHVRV